MTDDSRTLFDVHDDRGDDWSDRQMSQVERDALAQGLCVVAWAGEGDDGLPCLHIQAGDESTVWGIVSELDFEAPLTPVWVNGYRITRSIEA